ncbi:MAG TPA: acetamidase/formamidase family protein [Candidatus Limnocylindria bacterium]|nr:acetamidase/formamidase family protein [Candidatus Limnocylindria bacterium]
MSVVRELGCETVHYAWDNAIAPRLEIDEGETVRVVCRDAFDGAYSRDSTAVVKRVAKGHPLTGPVAIRGAQPGDVLQVDVLDLVPGGFGVTTFVPDRGLLAGDFPEPYLKVWDLRGTTAQLRPGVRVPLAPFLGVMGVALAEPGEHSTIPPRAAGGNMDIKQLTRGSTLYLPIAVPGALFSCGDGHAAQGDGEVCITAIETTMTATLRFTVRRDLRIVGPEFETASAGALPGRHHVTTGVAPDLMDATKAAVRAMISHLVTVCGLTREEAYVLCSVAADLKISEVVDAPNWVVSAFLPLSLFG